MDPRIVQQQDEMNPSVSNFSISISSNVIIVRNYMQWFNYTIFNLTDQWIDSRKDLFLDRIDFLEKKLELRISKQITVQIPYLDFLSTKIESLQRQVNHLKNSITTTPTTKLQPRPQSALKQQQ